MSPSDAPLFEDTLIPHRSLGPRGFRALMLGALAASTAFSIAFYLMGAWPVIGFFGLDVAAVYFAFRANYRSARNCEQFRLTYYELEFARMTPAGGRRAWRLVPNWVRLERMEDEEYGLLRLTLSSRGRSWLIGRGVGPERKAEFADRLASALTEARQGPRYS